MTLFTHPRSTRKIFSAHPPRTGGRYLRQLLEENGWRSYYNNHGLIYRDQEIPHCDLTRYGDFIDLESVSVVGVVRNPLDRYLSIMTILVNDGVSESSRSKHSNFFTPQDTFFPKESFLWKFESGFKEDFTDWLETISETKLDKVPVVPKASFDGLVKIKSTVEMEVFCSIFYQCDYKRFEYAH